MQTKVQIFKSTIHSQISAMFCFPFNVHFRLWIWTSRYCNRGFIAENKSVCISNAQYGTTKVRLCCL